MKIRCHYPRQILCISAVVIAVFHQVTSGCRCNAMRAASFGDALALAGLAVIARPATAANGDTRLVDAYQAQGREGIPGAADPRRCECGAARRRHGAALGGHWNDLEAVDAPIKAGANVNAVNGLGITPLSWPPPTPARRWSTRLLAAGANANPRCPRANRR